MCRMIAATGSFDAKALKDALALMAGNVNPSHDHERRSLGDRFTHEDGWGAAWVEHDRLRVRHSVHSCLTDPLFDELDGLSTDLLVLHARRASRPGTVSLENTHPFLAEHRGRTWAFCHNGVVHDLRPLHPAIGLTRTGTMDSELLFYHVLNYLDEASPERSLVASLEPFRDYTALHCILAAQDQVFAVAKRHPEKGEAEYHALWEGHGPNLHVVSSEPIEGIGCESWQRIDEPSVVTLKRQALTLPA